VQLEFPPADAELPLEPLLTLAEFPCDPVVTVEFPDTPLPFVVTVVECEPSLFVVTWQGWPFVVTEVCPPPAATETLSAIAAAAGMSSTVQRERSFIVFRI
jgi:hypothetical protein